MFTLCLRVRVQYEPQLTSHIDLPEDVLTWRQRGRALLSFAVEMGSTLGAERMQVVERLQLLVEAVETNMRINGGGRG